MTYDIHDLLAHLDPARLCYQDWVNVGMALKDEGLSAADWDAWSQRDPARYHAGECERKWKSFAGATNPVTVGTIVQLAREQGYNPPRADDYALDWDAEIGRDDTVIIDHNWIESRDVPPPPGDEDWHPARQLIRYLELIFEASETVNYVTESWWSEEKQKFLPSRGAYDRTAGELIQALSGCDDDIGAVLGDYKPDVGAWIRFNPLDGKGVKNENVTEYRYALVESDAQDIDRQYSIIHELELPVAVLVHSGGKSLHAIVHIDASDYTEYRKRVDYLYGVCERNGLKIDSQNRNPSRLSRMPGVTRNGNRQYIVAENIGKKSYDEWYEWVESVTDDLPEPENMGDIWDNLPALAPTLIEGVLRQGHKLLLAGPSKAGKSYSLIELCIAIAEGLRWLGWQCARGRVLYVNLELDRASCLHRFQDVYTALGIAPRHITDIDIWNLRGKAIPMDKLAPKLIRRAAKKGYIAIVIDPIYKVITGDENSADQMAKFCNQFDLVCSELGCAVIYCHHHSKGTQGQKKSMDRASGSGVFARDPDAMLDMIELEVPDELRKAEADRAALEEALTWLHRCVKDADNLLSQDDACSLPQTLKVCEKEMSPPLYKALTQAVDEAKQAATKRTAWRIEGTLREFAPFPPRNLWFDYPVHHLDKVGSLGDIDPESEGRLQGRKNGKKAPKEDKAAERKRIIEIAYQALSINGEVSVMDIVEYTGKTENTIKSYIKENPKFKRQNGKVVLIDE